MEITAKTKESVAERALQAFDLAHMTKCHRLMQAGLNRETLEELIRIYREIEMQDIIDRTPEDRCPVPISQDDLNRPRPGCV